MNKGSLSTVFFMNNTVCVFVRIASWSRGDSNKYTNRMISGRITNFAVITNVVIKRVHCNSNHSALSPGKPVCKIRISLMTSTRHSSPVPCNCSLKLARS